MALIQRSLRNAWEYKFLWLFGFFVSVADGYSGAISNSDRKDWEWPAELRHLDIDPSIFILLGVAVLSLWIVFWVGSVLSEGALIHGVYRREQNLNAGFGDCWTAGLRHFLRLFGIILVATITGLTSVLVLAIFVVPGYLIAAPLGILLTILAVPALLVLIVLVVSVEGWALRFAVIHNQPWLEAIQQGWRLFSGNVGKTLAVAVASVVTQFVLGCIFILGLVLLAIPFIIVGLIDLWTAVIPGAIVGLVLVLAAPAYLGTFASSVWTLGFMGLTGHPNRP
jgi:hypothetical protein